MIRPLIKEALVHKNFFRDLGKDEEKVDSIVNAILDCTNLDFYELHKFEKIVAGNLIFRAKRDGIHFVYSVNRNEAKNIIFLRAIKNFPKYKQLLSDEKRIKNMLNNLTS